MVLIWETEGLVWFSCVKAFTFGVEISELSTVGLGESVRDTTLDRAADTSRSALGILCCAAQFGSSSRGGVAAVGGSHEALRGGDSGCKDKGEAVFPGQGGAPRHHCGDQEPLHQDPSAVVPRPPVPPPGPQGQVPEG